MHRSIAEASREDLPVDMSDKSAEAHTLLAESTTVATKCSNALCTIRAEVDHTCLMEKIRLNWQAAQSVAFSEMSSNEEGGVKTYSIAAKR